MYINIQVNLFFISAVIRCQQLITVDEKENQPRELKFGTHIIFSVQMKNPIIFFFILVVISCQGLKTVDENENKPGELKFGANHLKGV